MPTVIPLGPQTFPRDCTPQESLMTLGNSLGQIFPHNPYGLSTVCTRGTGYVDWEIPYDHFLPSPSPTFAHKLFKYRISDTFPHTCPLHLPTHFSSTEPPTLAHTLVIHTQVSHRKAELLHTLAMAPFELPPCLLLVFLGEGNRRRWRWSLIWRWSFSSRSSCSRSSGSGSSCSSSSSWRRSHSNRSSSCRSSP